MKYLFKDTHREILKILFIVWEHRLKVSLYIIFTATILAYFQFVLPSPAKNGLIPEDYRFIIVTLISISLTVAIIEPSSKVIEFFYKRFHLWKSLTSEELEFISYYIKQNIKTKYIEAYNGSWSDSGTISLLRRKRIIYLASIQSEFRSEDGHWMTRSHYFPFNMYDDAFNYFKKSFSQKSTP